MRKLVGAALMIDGVLQAMGVAGVVSTIVDRDLRDQFLFAGHLMVGAVLVLGGRMLFAGSQRRALALPLVAALLLSVFETMWFNWIGLVGRAAYTSVALIVLLRKTTLPTT